jgi:PIN domain nuclease of toxin-antitoxin system
MDVRILADTNVFILFTQRLPLPSKVEEALDSTETERFISAVSVIEIFRLWQSARLPDNPDTWLDLALASWTVLPMTAPIARQSALWPWSHRDPADRIIAATAQIEKIELWHTDTVLKGLTGFPHRYFRNRLN